MDRMSREDRDTMPAIIMMMLRIIMEVMFIIIITAFCIEISPYMRKKV